LPILHHRHRDDGGYREMEFREEQGAFPSATWERENTRTVARRSTATNCTKQKSRRIETRRLFGKRLLEIEA
jgi:hypothetical protein